uniref:Tripartite motif containing 25, like n=1 Tax=Cynoglossus semilaevis TaxID=244447 RepID=A0A3P8W5V5_CYNSE
MSGKLWTEEQFNCPVCLDLPNDPVTIPCGHSYCMGCIKDYWSKDDPKGIYSCPQCRQTFCPKPNLSRNTMLAEAVEQLRKSEQTRRGSTMSTMSSKSRGKLNSSQVPCDLCKGEQRVAVKSCLVCMSSYCETHLKPHQTKKSLKQHELIAPTWNLAEKICTQHKYLQEFFCRQCKMFICWLCTSNLHKGHECVSTKAERMEKQVRPAMMATVQLNTVTLSSNEQVFSLGSRSSSPRTVCEFKGAKVFFPVIFTVMQSQTNQGTLFPDSVILTLDPNTAHRRLILSEGNTKATLQGAVQLYPDTPQRFDGWMQVMCQNPLSAQRCYWEVEWRGRGSSMGLAYGALCRKGSDARSGLGYNCQSWTLELSDTCCSAMHDNQKKDIPVTYSPRLGVYLDLNAGTLAFYSVAENMTHLHTFRANFTQPVYAAFGVGSGVGVEPEINY